MVSVSGMLFSSVSQSRCQSGFGAEFVTVMSGTRTGCVTVTSGSEGGCDTGISGSTGAGCVTAISGAVCVTAVSGAVCVTGISGWCPLKAVVFGLTVCSSSVGIKKEGVGISTDIALGKNLNTSNSIKLLCLFLANFGTPIASSSFSKAAATGADTGTRVFSF